MGERASDAEIDFNSIFSLRKPRDAKAGLASGAKSVAKGVLAGAIGLFAAPAVGAHQEGFKGFAKGAAAGIAGAVVLPVTGVAVGAAQVVRGLANTPEAVRESAKGHQWDAQQRRWIEQPGTALILDDGSTANLRRLHNASSASQEDYYSLLGVPRDATGEEIKRAYYLAARRLHPDKNPEDPVAKERFQALAQAYQVLGNEELRRRYDSHGTQGLDVNFVDGAEFFAALFGNDRFEHLVGELMLAAAARAGPELNAAGLKQMQLAREAQLEVRLVALLRRWVEGDESGFRDSMAKEAEGLAGAPYGEKMLYTIGRTYEVQASIHLGGVLDGSFAALKAQGRSIKSQFKAASLALKVYQAQQQLSQLEMQAERAQQAVMDSREQADSTGENREVHPGAAQPISSQVPATDPAQLAAAAAAASAERARMEEESLPLMLDAMWAANALDIEATLTHVCRRVLQDKEVSKAHRRRRAEGLLELGRIFRAVGKKPSATSSTAGSSGEGTEAKRQMEEAMMRVVEKRMQADDDASKG